MGTAERGPLTSQLGKYFLHGIAFSLLFIVLAVVWVFIAAMLIVAGLFIGLIISLAILFYLIGGLNAVLTDLIWSFKVKTRWVNLLGQGFVLFFVLLLAHVPAFIMSLTVPNLIMSVVLFIVYTFIDGFIAKQVADWSKPTPEEYEYKVESEMV